MSVFPKLPRAWAGMRAQSWAGIKGDQPVDTGFIVFNYVNYPHLTQMFRDLDVPVQRSDMSFGASIGDGRVEYGLQTLSALFGQPPEYDAACLLWHGA